MNNIGNLIKRERKNRKWSQLKLSEGICTQATISNLEKGYAGTNMSILLALMNRLEIQLDNSILEFNILGFNKDLFEQIENLCLVHKYREAHDILSNSIKEKNLEKIHLKHYYYLCGVTSLFAVNNISDAIYYFNQALDEERDKNKYLDCLIMNNIGITYFKNNEREKAQTYIDKSIKLLDGLIDSETSSNKIVQLLKVYYNSANFYSEINNYLTSYNLCTFGLKAAINHNTNHFIEYLQYEKAYSLIKLKKKEEAKKYYFLAASSAISKNNTKVLDIVKGDIRQYNLEPYEYWKT